MAAGYSGGAPVLYVAVIGVAGGKGSLVGCWPPSIDIDTCTTLTDAQLQLGLARSFGIDVLAACGRLATGNAAANKRRLVGALRQPSTEYKWPQHTFALSCKD